MQTLSLVLIVVGAVCAVTGVVVLVRGLPRATQSRHVLGALSREQQRSVARAVRDGEPLPPELLPASRHAAEEVARTGAQAFFSLSTVVLMSGMLVLLGGRADTSVWVDVLCGSALVIGVMTSVVSLRTSCRGRRYLRSHP